MDKSNKQNIYKEFFELAKNSPQKFWAKEALEIYWQKNFKTIFEGDFSNQKWFLEGELNACENCLDRHVKRGLEKKTAIIWEKENGENGQVSYEELLKITCDIASLLLEHGVSPGDRVAIYMPMTVDAIASMLACARIGAVHTVIFGGFSKESLIDRIFDSKAKIVITTEVVERKGQKLYFKKIVDEALLDIRIKNTKILCLSEKLENILWPSEVINPKGFNSEHPLFILYTSGTTGKPKGLFHSTGGYLTQVACTMSWVFDLKKQDIFWCTADIGWITGHSYVAYGPLLLGKTIFIYDGALNYPDFTRFYKMLEKFKISVLYTAPTFIRMLMAAGEKIIDGFDLSSLRLLGSVGEPINPAAYKWYQKYIGQSRCPVIDSWWQTETGAMMIVPIPGVHDFIAGSASKPFLGIEAFVHEDGSLLIKKPWPSMARGIWGDKERFKQTYLEKYPGFYYTGDGAKVDENGNFYISGRIDDVVNISGHRLGTAEVESALVLHKSVSEAAVVGIPDLITGQQIVAFVTLSKGEEESKFLQKELKDQVKNIIGAFAKPKEIYFKKSLPKTRSGKIMRRLLKSEALGEIFTGDISTLEEFSLS